MAKRRVTLLRQVLATLGVAVFVIMSAFLIVTHTLQKKLLLQSEVDHMLQELRSFRVRIQAQLEVDEAGVALADIHDKIGDDGDANLLLYYFGDESGLTLHSSPTATDEDVPLRVISEVIKTPDIPPSHINSRGDPPTASVALPLYDLADGRLAAVLCYTRSILPARQLAWQFLFTQALGLLGLLAVSVCAMYVVIQRKLGKPVLALYIHLHQAAHGEYHYIDSAYDPGNEISSLYNTFNVLLTKIIEQDRLVKHLQEKKQKRETVNSTSLQRADEDETR